MLLPKKERWIRTGASRVYLRIQKQTPCHPDKDKCRRGKGHGSYTATPRSVRRPAPRNWPLPVRQPHKETARRQVSVRRVGRAISAFTRRGPVPRRGGARCRPRAQRSCRKLELGLVFGAVAVDVRAHTSQWQTSQRSMHEDEPRRDQPKLNDIPRRKEGVTQSTPSVRRRGTSRGAPDVVAQRAPVACRTQRRPWFGTTPPVNGIRG